MEMEIRELRVWNNQYLREPKILLDEDIIYVPVLTEVHSEQQKISDNAICITYLLIHPFLKRKITFQITVVYSYYLDGGRYVYGRSFKKIPYDEAAKILGMGPFKGLYEHYSEWSYEVFGDDP